MVISIDKETTSVEKADCNTFLEAHKYYPLFILSWPMIYCVAFIIFGLLLRKFIVKRLINVLYVTPVDRAHEIIDGVWLAS